jgi:hypothetical protein
MAPAPPKNAGATAWLAVPAAAALLALRKPWALHTPQFWAEDGSIFMQQDHDWGARAILEPYNGYLHLLPRLIAWLASRTADVAWWPAIYNGLSFAITVALFARLASRRVELPGKAGLMLAFAVVAGTGEVLINATNLQWVTAFFLVLQLFTARAETGPQRLGDLAILGVVGLNGPFALVLLPLFAWRAWRERSLDPALALGVVALCAAVQGRFVLGGSLSLDGTSAPFRPLMFLSIIGSRLVTWPIFGPAAVKAWPLLVHAILGVAFIGAVAAHALRRDARRPLRAMILAAFALMTLACVARVRADTWRDDNLVNGDRYFYISRVLLAWLVLLELHAPRRAVAWTARAVCLAAVLTHAPHFVLRAPPDYQWAEHCDPIRRGTPANILTLPEGWWIEYPGRGATRR